MIRDRLVCGVQHDGIQKAEKDLTYDKALELAKSIEAAENSRQIKNGSGAAFTEPPPKLHYAASGKTPKSTFKDTPVVCYRCGGNHSVNSKRPFVVIVRRRDTLFESAGQQPKIKTVRIPKRPPTPIQRKPISYRRITQRRTCLISCMQLKMAVTIP